MLLDNYKAHKRHEKPKIIQKSSTNVLSSSNKLFPKLSKRPVARRLTSKDVVVINERDFTESVEEHEGDVQ